MLFTKFKCRITNLKHTSAADIFSKLHIAITYQPLYSLRNFTYNTIMTFYTMFIRHVF